MVHGSPHSLRSPSKNEGHEGRTIRVDAILREQRGGSRIQGGSRTRPYMYII